MYAKYYDLLYKDKNYPEESEYIEKFIRRYNSGAKKILDLGCGTGKHDFIFADKGFDVTGVELSDRMIDEANLNKKNSHKNLNFYQGDIRNITLNEKFDVIISLFHVMSYQNTNEDLTSTLKTVKDHLNEGGIFLFDFWYGPAVISERPEERLKKLEDEEVYIERFAKPEIYVNENLVGVSYKVFVTEKRDNSISEINELHTMRYLFIPELKLLLNNAGMKLLLFEEWMTGRVPDDKSWSVFAAASKISENK